MGDTKVRFKCATAVRLSAARAVHARHRFPVSAHVRRRLEKLRHLASVRLTCMQRYNLYIGGSLPTVCYFHIQFHPTDWQIKCDELAN